MEKACGLVKTYRNQFINCKQFPVYVWKYLLPRKFGDVHGEHYIIESLNAIYQRRWKVSILASGGEHQSIRLHKVER